VPDAEEKRGVGREEMSEQRPAFLSDRRLRLVLCGGKGGVGKTTVAAATALYRASQEPERRILLVSTDPAHSLSDSLDQAIGDRITSIEGKPNLSALEMDAAQRLGQFKGQYGDVLKTIADRGTLFDQEDISRFFDLSLPGLDELILEVADILREGEYDLVILDTAPTGHTLRLLALPELLEEWLHVLDLMLAKHRYMASLFGRYRPDETDAFLERMSSDLCQLRQLLSDGERTEFVPVVIPEAMSLEETSRLLESLETLHLHVRSMVVNRVAPQGAQRACPFCAARHNAQRPYLEAIEHRFPGCDLVWVPLLPREVRGQKALQGYTRAMLGGGAPALDGRAALPSAGWPDPSRRDGRERAIPAERPALATRQLLLFGGKGGVGKTTVAAATAIHLARTNPGTRTLLFSTDPAHSLSDSLGQAFGNQITSVAGVDGLWALEMEAGAFLEELKEVYAAEMEEAFSFMGRSLDAPFDRRVMKELVSVTPPGLDELMALTKVMDLMDGKAFDRYVLDMAPTGHALRLLEMPGLVRQWFITFFRLLLKYQGVITLTRIADLLRLRSKQLRRVEQLLADPSRYAFVTVTIPEAMAVLETDRLLRRLDELAIACPWIVVNMVVPASGCETCAAMREGQRRHLQALDELAPNAIQVPLFPHEIRGVDDLAQVARVLYGDGNGQSNTGAH
jgi:arsenite-transporting ATPase